MKDHRRIAEDFARRLRSKFGGKVEQVILFGSVARGDDREDSDVDVLVITPDTSWAFRRVLAAEAVDLLVHEGVYVSAKPVSRAEYERTAGTLFGRNLRREGLVLA